MRIACDAITVDVPGHRALDRVSVDFASGSITAVIGPSGAGKSTLLGVLAGLIAPDAGTVRFDDREVTSLPAEARQLGVVFQELRLFDFLSARDNVAFAPRVAGLRPAERVRRVDEALRQVRARDLADRSARVLSGGERQRIAIARALAAQPRALLFDEPFASLDVELRRNIRDELRELVCALGLTAIVVTHDRDDAFALASQLVVLRGGRVEQAGDAAELYARPATEAVATLLGEASFVPVDARQGDVVQVAGLTRVATGRGQRALLRPEQLRLEAAGGWPARVVAARFSGAVWRVTLDAGRLGLLIALVETPPATDTVSIIPPPTLHTL
jgi:ABC-type sulfate/molybdate transport systems ATPase subunit